MLEKKLCLATSTAAIAIFDEACLDHRMNQPADWWSDFMDEIDEVNKGNAIIVGLGTDGIYNVDVRVVETPKASTGKVVVGLLKNVSGRLYVGPGEEIVGGGYKPSTLRHPTGVFLDLPPATYRVSVTKGKQNDLSVVLLQVDEPATNSIEDQLLLEE